MFKKSIVFAFLFSLSSILALEPIEKLLIQKAILPEQKKAVKEYLLKIAKDHRQLSQKYMEMSQIKRGGKHKYDEKHRKEMKRIAKKFEKDAITYEQAANKL